MSDREREDMAFGDPADAGVPSRPIARHLGACPDCQCTLARPSLSCPSCGRRLDDSPEGRAPVSAAEQKRRNRVVHGWAFRDHTDAELRAINHFLATGDPSRLPDFYRKRLA